MTTNSEHKAAPALDAAPWPASLNFDRSVRALHIEFDDGAAFDIPFELLRVESPSAEVQGHGGKQKNLVAGKRAVGVTDAQPVGNYAIRIVFDDGHDTGLFTWPYLYKLGAERDALMTRYAEALSAAGLSRD